MPLVRGGRSVEGARSGAMEARERALHGLACLDETQLRMLNPHTYPVGFDRRLFELRNDLVSRARHYE